MHECCPQHLSMCAARMKEGIETDEEDDQKIVNKEERSGHEIKKPHRLSFSPGLASPGVATLRSSGLIVTALRRKTNNN